LERKAGTLPLLVFTASFMIAGGMQVILSRPADTRAVYVIGISTLLALSITVYPKSFQDLPTTVRSFANSSLVLCLTAALGLTLLFRIGTRRFGQIEWNDSEESVSSAVDFLRCKAKDWKIGAGLIEIGADHVREVIAYVVEHHLRHRSGTLRAIFNGRIYSLILFTKALGQRISLLLALPRSRRRATSRMRKQPPMSACATSSVA
jgi:xanthine permease XanP